MKWNDFWLFFIFVMITILISNQIGNCQINREALRSEMVLLKESIAQQSQIHNHHTVESALDRILEIMKQIDAPIEDQSKQAQQRIQYSLNTKRFFSAYNAAAAWLEGHPTDSAVTNLLASAALMMNRYREARDFLRQVYESNPEHYVYQERYLNVLKKLNEQTECKELCNTILANPNNPMKLKLEVVDVLIDIESEQDALDTLDSMGVKENNLQLAAFAQAKLLMKDKRYNEALAAFQKVESKHPRYTQAQTQIALCYSSLRRFEDAAKQNLLILGSNLYDQSAYINLAQSLARMRQPHASKVVMTQHNQLEQAEMPVKEGNYYWSKGDMVEFGRLHAIGMNLKHQFHQAELLLEAVAQSLPESTPAKINLGKHYFTTLQAVKAEKLFRQLVKQAEENEKQEIQLLLAEALLRQDQPDEAVNMFDTAVGNNKEAYCALLGTYYLEIKQEPDNALRYLAQIQHATTIITAAKAKCLLQLHQPQDAHDMFLQIPQDQFTAEQKTAFAECMIQIGNIEEAEILFKQTMKDNPNLPKFLFMPVQALLLQVKNDPSYHEWQQKTNEMIEIHQEIQHRVTEAQRKGLPDSIPILKELSILFESVGDQQNALLYARRVYDAAPNEPEHLFRFIRLLTTEQHIIERYHLIHKAREITNTTGLFEEELNGIYSKLGFSQ